MAIADYPNMSSIISALSSQIIEALGDELLGLYVFGSLVGGDFDVRISDIDLLAITSNEVSDELLERLKQMHETFVEKNPEWNDRVEVAYVPERAMKSFKQRPSIIARISPGESLHRVEASIHWLMDWYMVQEKREVIYGPRPTKYIPHISQDEFIHEVKKHMSFWREWAEKAKTEGYQAYVVLLMCRNMYAVRHGIQTSKLKGAAWAKEEYPQWADFIETAISWRESKSKKENPEGHKKTKQFVEFALNTVGV